MPTPTYTLLDSVTLTSSASSVTFSSISATGKGDLVLVVTHTSAAGNLVRARLNGDTGSNYFYVQAQGDGSTLSSSSTTNTSLTGEFAGTTPSVTITQITDYAATNKHKSILGRMNRPTGRVRMVAERWANTAAVSSIECFASNDTFDAGSTFFLYQIVSE
jgi:uncharacterized protein (UPF0333 family)